MDEKESGYLARNAAGLARLRRLAERVRSPEGQRVLSGGWTSSAILAHLAFWDRFVLARWDQYGRAGRIETLPDSHLDLVNEAELPLWLALEPRIAVVQVLDAATNVSSRIAGLGTEAVAYAVQTSRPAMLDRTVHWLPHLDELEKALESEGPPNRAE